MGVDNQHILEFTKMAALQLVRACGRASAAKTPSATFSMVNRFDASALPAHAPSGAQERYLDDRRPRQHAAQRPAEKIAPRMHVNMRVVVHKCS